MTVRSSSKKLSQEPLKLIYIVSPRYSGSTLLSFLLGTHPDVSTIGERKKFYIKSLKPDHQGDQHCSCGKLFVECEYWNQIREGVLARVRPDQLATNVTNFRLFRNKYLNRLAQGLVIPSLVKGKSVPFKKKIQNLCEVNRIIVEEVLKLDGNHVFLDSSKPIRQAVYLDQIDNLDLYVIHLVRDPRAQISSALKYNEWTTEQATRIWIREMNLNQRIFQRWNVARYDLRYEDLCRKPEEKLKEMLTFAGLNPDLASLDFRKFQQHIMGNQSMRLGGVSEIKERRDWQKRLADSDVKIIEKLTQDFRHYYAD